MDAFGALTFQVIGQQLSVNATRRIVARFQELFLGRLPTPAELLAVDAGELRKAGLSGRKVATLRAVAAEFVAGSLSETMLRGLPDHDIEGRLTVIRGIGPWTVHGPALRDDRRLQRQGGSAPRGRRGARAFQASGLTGVAGRRRRDVASPSAGNAPSGRFGEGRSAAGTCRTALASVRTALA
jgi:hypothetical protein